MLVHRSVVVYQIPIAPHPVYAITITWHGYAGCHHHPRTIQTYYRLTPHTIITNLAILSTHIILFRTMPNELHLVTLNLRC